MNDVILIITEGLKPEHDKLKEIKNLFLSKKRNIVLSPDVGSILNLCKDIKAAPYLDYLSWLKEKGKTNDIIDSLSVDDISEVFLFFDYDCHGITKNDFQNTQLINYNKDLQYLLEVCNESTSQLGKLFISYPMIESLWDIPKNSNFSNCNNNCFYDIDKLKHYKQIITNKNNDRNKRSMDLSLWKKYLSIHIDRFFLLTNCENYKSITSLTYKDVIDYDLNLLHKIESYLSETYHKVFAINPLPFFIIEIGGEKGVESFLIDIEKPDFDFIKTNCCKLFLQIKKMIN